MLMLLVLQYPYALARLAERAGAEWDTAALRADLAGFPPAAMASPAALLAHARDLTQRDDKAPYWKQLQGRLWKQGYGAGALRTELFGDAVPALEQMGGGGKTLAVFSSGSVEAQTVFFAHVVVVDGGGTAVRDINGLFAAKFDPGTAGPKTRAASYEAISAALGVEPRHAVFLTDSADGACASGPCAAARAEKEGERERGAANAARRSRRGAPGRRLRRRRGAARQRRPAARRDRPLPRRALARRAAGRGLVGGAAVRRAEIAGRGRGALLEDEADVAAVETASKQRARPRHHPGRAVKIEQRIDYASIHAHDAPSPPPPPPDCASGGAPSR